MRLLSNGLRNIRSVPQRHHCYQMSHLIQQAGKVIEFTATDLTRKVQEIIDQVKKGYSDYLFSGKMNDEVIKSTIRLAQLDPIFRARIIDENIGIVYDEDVADLRNLISIVNPDLFRAKKLCLLNPTFGKGSRIVGGADVDLLLDNTMIDIKTTKKLEFKRPYLDQLIGYYVLHEIGGIGELKPKLEIGILAIYFSRYAYLYTFEVQQIVNRKTFTDFMHWFKKRASKEFGDHKL